MLEGICLIVCFAFFLVALLVFLKREKLKQEPDRTHLAKWYLRLGVTLAIFGAIAGAVTIGVTVAGPQGNESHTYEGVTFNMPSGWYQSEADDQGATFKNDAATSDSTQVRITSMDYPEDITGLAKPELADKVKAALQSQYPEEEGRTIDIASDYYEGSGVVEVSATITDESLTQSVACFIVNGKLYTVDYSCDSTEKISQPLTTIVNSIHSAS